MVRSPPAGTRAPAPTARALLAVLMLVAAASAQPAARGARPDPQLPVATWSGVEVVAGEALVRFAPTASAAARVARHAQVGAIPVGDVAPGLARVRFDTARDLDAVLAAYRAFPEVAAVQPNVLHRPVAIPDDVKWPQQWGTAKVGAPGAWDVYAGRADALVAIIDTGVDVDHPDLAAHYAGGWDTYANDADPDDLDGHGTHCAGIAAAQTDNGLGIAGAAYGCRFIAYRVGNTTFATSAIVPAIDAAVAQGALVLSMSWGSSYADPAIAAALEAAAAAGCVLVAAAGNDGTTQPFHPAALPSVIGVAASKFDDGRAWFSNHGDWVDLAAPGQTIYSTYAGGGYAYLSGTSMACPLVAGIALHLYAALGVPRSTAAAVAVRDALLQSALPVGAWVQAGRVDHAAALDRLVPPALPAASAVAPSAVRSLGDVDVVVTGTGLLHVDTVTLGGLPLPPGAHAPLDDRRLAIDLPPIAALGPSALVVGSALGTSAPLTLAVGANDPPGLLVPATVAAGAPCAWTLGGAPGAAYYLLVSLTTSTFPYAGLAIVSDPLVIAAGALDAAGLATSGFTIPAGAAGVTFRSQLVTAGAGLAASAIHPTSIAP